MESLKKKSIIISIVLLLSFTIMSIVNSVNAMSVASILDDIKDVQTFLRRPYTDYLGKHLYWNDRGENIYDQRLTCIAHWQSTEPTYGYEKVITQVIDLNLDKTNSIKLNGNEYKGDKAAIFQALAKATSESNQSGTRNKNEVTIYNLICDLSRYIDTGGAPIDRSNYGWHDAPGSEEYYYSCIAYGENVVKNSVSGKVSNDKYDKNLIETTVENNKCYLGPFQYSYDQKGNVSFASIEINGDNNASQKIDNPGTNNLFVKTKKGFSSVKNGNIKPDTDFYILADKKFDESDKISVKIKVGGAESYKSRILIIKDITGGQALAAYSTGAGKQNSTNMELVYEFENHKGDLEIYKDGVKFGQSVNAVKSMGFRVYYLENDKKHYLKIETDTKLVNDKLVGAVKVKKQTSTTSAKKATVIYTNKTGLAALKGIDTRYKYYLEEVSDSSDYSTNVISAYMQTIIPSNLPTGLYVDIFKDGVIGPITVNKRGTSSIKTWVRVTDDIKRGKLRIEKQDAETGKGLANVDFKVRTSSGLWVVATKVKSGSYTLKTYDDYAKNERYFEENFTTDADKATVFTTNKNGIIVINGLDKGTYKVKEIANRNYGYRSFESQIIVGATVNGEAVPANKIKKNQVTVTIDGNNKGTAKTTFIMKNQKQLGELIIDKIDKDSKKPLQGVSFKIKRYNAKEDKYKYVAVSKNDYIAGEEWVAEKEVTGEFTVGSMKYTTNPNKATTFVTDANGRIKLNDILAGKYQVEEVSVGNNPGYTADEAGKEIEPKSIKWVDSANKEHDLPIEIEVTNKKDASTKITVKNEMQYLRITGKVWKDMPEKTKITNYEVYGKDIYREGDELVEGITVNLIDKATGNKVASTTTNKSGEYEFKNVSIAKLKDPGYYVEFEYDGLTYTDVIPLAGEKTEKNNSKASEKEDDRNSLNKAFTEITNKQPARSENGKESYGYSRDASSNVTGELTYDSNYVEGTIQHDNESKFKSTTANTTVTANTDITPYNLSEHMVRNEKTNQFEVTDINLGLKERYKPELGVSNDVENVQIDINGYSHIYRKGYNTRDTEKTAFRDETNNNFNVAVKFAQGKGYFREVYPSDIKYSEDTTDDSKKLKVYVTYATNIYNPSLHLKSQVNELVNYHDSRYTIEEAWIGDSDGKNKVECDVSETSKYGLSYNANGYKAAYIKPKQNVVIDPAKNAVLHIKFKVNDDAVKGLLSEDATLNNVSEILSYTTYDSDNNVYAGIDKYSAPGNAVPGEKTTYEADTDEAPSLILIAKGARMIEGTVFEDNATAESLANNERLGSGILESDENKVKDVKVELLEVTYDSEGKEVLTRAKTYPTMTDEKGNLIVDTYQRDMTVTEPLITKEDGKYIFRGIEPGYYYIKFTYNNGETKIIKTGSNEEKDISVENYKSTIITSDDIKKAFENNDTNNKWYQATKGKNYSSAVDDYEQRKAIDDAVNGTGEMPNNGLWANTPKMFLDVECDDIETISAVDSYEYKVADINFGIIERPQQKAELRKVVTDVILTLPNGQPMGGKVETDENGNITGLPEGLYETESTIDGEIVKVINVNLDPELVRGSHIEIDYALKLTNSSEKDYVSREYYYYGEKIGDMVKFNGVTLLDYVDKSLVVKDNQTSWEIIGSAGQYVPSVGFDWNPNGDLLKKFSAVTKIDLDSELKPGETADAVTLKLEKLLDNNDQELTFENNCEVVDVKKDGGAKYSYKLANFAEELEIKEADESRSYSVKVVPGFGENRSATYAIIAVASLAVLGIGVFGTRKFLKK